MSNLHLTLMDMLGLPAERFGNSTGGLERSAGPLTDVHQEARMRASAVRRVAAGFVLLLSIPAGAQRPDLRLVDAVRHGDRQAASTLVRARVDVNARQPDGATALHWAAYLDDFDAADLLLGAGATPDAANELGVTPLYLACENGSAALVRRLLAAARRRTRPCAAARRP